MANGWTLRKGFKSVVLHAAGRGAGAGRVQFQPAKLEATVDMLSQAVNSAKTHRQIDNITLKMIMSGLAEVRKSQGDTEGAGTTLKDMIDTFKARKLKDSILDRIRREAKSLLSPD
jgi:hypothetical protein